MAAATPKMSMGREPGALNALLSSTVVSCSSDVNEHAVLFV